MTRLILVVLLWLGLAGDTLAAPPPVVLDAHTTQADLQGSLESMEDAGGRRTLVEIQQLQRAGIMQPVRRAVVSARPSADAAVWIHFRVRPQAGAPQRWWLNAAEHLMGQVDVYVVRDDHVVDHREGGLQQPFEQREVAWRQRVFELALVPEQTTDLYLRYTSEHALRLMPSLTNAVTLDHQRSRDTLMLGAYFGIMTLVAAISAFQALRLRLLTDGLYAAYVLAMESANAVLFGFAEQFGFLSGSTAQYAAVNVFALLAGAALANVAHRVIGWPELLFKRVSKPLYGLLILYIGGFAALALFGSLASVTVYLRISSILLATLTLAAGCWAVWKRLPNARLFLGGFAPFLMVIMLRLAQAAGWITGVTWLEPLVLLTTVLHAVLLLSSVWTREATLRQVKQQLDRQLERLQEEAQHQALFIRMLSHEVRTPLAIIDNRCQLLQRSPLALASTQHVEQIRQASNRLSAMVDRVLHQDRVTSQSTVEKKDLNLPQLLEGVTAQVQSQTEHHLLRLVAALPPIQVQGDVSLLRILFLNLLENAVLYSPEGGAIEVEVRLDVPGRVEVAITDEGVGIPLEAQTRIFERYYRTGQVHDACGTGLGLYLARHIAHMHGGDVWCESAPGEGSTFIVSLPRTV